MIGMEELSLSQRQKVEKWFAEKANVIGKCPVCRERNYTLLNHIVAPPVFQGGSVVIGGPAYPMIMIMCQNCGYTSFHNAMVIGLLANEGPDSVKQDEADANINPEVSDG